MVFGLPADSLPIQVGPATDYARQKRKVLFVILAIQVAVMAFRLLFHLDIIGACLMGLQVAIGAYAWQQDMNITYLFIYGVVCFINGIMTLLAAIIPMIISFATLHWLTTISALFLPIANFSGAYLVYLVYQDFVQARKAAAAQPIAFAAEAGMFGGLFGGAGGLFGGAGEAAPLKGKQNEMFAGQGYTLGSSDAYMAQGRAYGQDAMKQGSAYGQAGMAYGQAGMAQGRAYGQAGMGQAQAGYNDAYAGFAGGGGQAPHGQADVTHDPFLTR